MHKDYLEVIHGLIIAELLCYDVAMKPNEIYKLFGPISVGVTWLTVAFVIHKWRGDKSMSISRHAATHKAAYLTMLVVESIVLPMFFLFVAKWVTPVFDLPSFFTVCVGIAASGLVVAAWIPDVKGWKNIVHGMAAYGAAMLFIPASTVLYLSPSISPFARNMSLFVLIYELVAVTSFTVSEKARSYHLYVQTAYIILFDLSILAVAYIVR